eukprot:NODE_20378_length_801_cov_1.683976.p1 GENE.NODE_20378_length_801_cov_1.683976~~NODE_20378_length_801_cov_1.683976.p1  ORF type:complete len:164 (-),score=69.56 NODE_20378_length_801_cov_1.683976:2-493(-)
MLCSVSEVRVHGLCGVLRELCKALGKPTAASDLSHGSNPVEPRGLSGGAPRGLGHLAASSRLSHGKARARVLRGGAKLGELVRWSRRQSSTDTADAKKKKKKKKKKKTGGDTGLLKKKKKKKKKKEEKQKKKKKKLQKNLKKKKKITYLDDRCKQQPDHRFNM